MNDRIEFLFDKDDNFIAKLHTDGRIRIVRDKNDVSGLMRICYKNKYSVQGPGVITERADKINREFMDYMKRKHKGLYILGQITEKMRLVKKDKYLRRRLTAGALTGIIALTGFSIHNSHKDNTKAEEKPSYSDDAPIDSYDDSTYGEPYTEPTTTTTTPTETPKSPSYDYFNNNRDLDSMLQKMEFHYNYEKREDQEPIYNAKRYEDIFEKYAKQYGLDKNLVIALAAQESSGEHYGNLDNGCAEGIMQIEKDVHIGTTVTAYNFNTGEKESVDVTEENLRDLDTNIKVGCMILRNCIEQNDYNIPLSLQTYNFGPGNMAEALSACSANESVSEDRMKSDPTNTKWLNYREFLNTGDPLYVEHVFSYLPDETELTVLKRDGTPVSITLCNDQQKVPNLM